MLLPALIAGLFDKRAIVLVEPPLLARPAGSSCGSVFRLSLGPFRIPPGPVPPSPPAASLLMLKPLETMVPPLLTKLAPVAPVLKMELRSDIPTEPELKMPPATVELLL